MIKADPAVSVAIGAMRPIRTAAVLVPIIARAEPTVLFTQRTAHLADHAGEIAFPGGEIDAVDATMPTLRPKLRKVPRHSWAGRLPHLIEVDRKSRAGVQKGVFDLERNRLRHCHAETRCVAQARVGTPAPAVATKGGRRSGFYLAGAVTVE
jgi:hypothetical protein